jgi:hypothetical protein
VLLFTRQHEDQNLLVAVNISADKKTINIPKEHANLVIIDNSGFQSSYNPVTQEIELPPWQLCFARIQPA